MVVEISLKKERRRIGRFDTQCRTWMPNPGGHLCTCHTLDYVEDKDSLIHHHGDCNILHPLYLIENEY